MMQTNSQSWLTGGKGKKKGWEDGMIDWHDCSRDPQ